MNRGNRIPTPWPHKWRKFRYNVLPVLSFFTCLALTLWMWERQTTMPNGVGEVEIQSVDVTSLSGGKLIELTVQPHDPVEEGQLIARFDSQLIEADIHVLQKEVSKLNEDIEAQRAAISNDQISNGLRHASEMHRLALQVELGRVDLLDRHSLILADGAEYKRLEARIGMLEAIQIANRRSGPIATTELEVARLQKDVVKKRGEGRILAHREAKKTLEEARKRLAAYPGLLSPEVEQLLVPIRAAIEAQNARIKVLELQIRNLEIFAPKSGVVSAVHCTPEQNLQAGLPIVTIVDDKPRFIISYVRPEQKISPTVGMPVDVKVRSHGSRPIKTQIHSVGPSVEAISPHQLRDPTIPEWGRPVRILLPSGFNSLPPGELIDVSYRWWDVPQAK